MSNLTPNDQSSWVSPVPSTGRKMRVLAFMEATTLTGPAKNLIEFAQRARQANENSATLTVATFCRGLMTTPNAFTDRCREAGIDVRILRERFLFDPQVVLAIRRLVDELSPDLIQTHHVKSHFLLRLSGCTSDRVWIAFHHGYTQTSRKTEIYNLLDRWSLKGADKVITVCRPFSAELQSKGIPESKITVLHNSVKPAPRLDPTLATEIRDKMGFPRSATIVLSVGRLSREKGHRDAIHAIAELIALRPDQELLYVIVGDGPERQPLLELALKLNISKNVVFAGQQNDPGDFYRTCDLLLLPSHSEGSPNVLLEAMSFGLATVTTAVGGVPEISEDGVTAIHVPTSNPKAIAVAMARLLDDDQKRMQIGYAAREVVRKYAPEAYAEFMISYYRDCLTGHAQSRTPDGTEPSVVKQTGAHIQ
jgi:glycosyltransferase involved in cell wall biosynthesis